MKKPISTSKAMNELKALIKAKSKNAYGICKYYEKDNEDEISTRYFREYMVLEQIIDMIENKELFEELQNLYETKEVE